MYIGKWLYTLVILVLVSSCGGGGGGSPTPSTNAEIVDFTTSDSSIVAGTEVALNAVFSGGTANIDNGVGSVVSNSQISVTPAITTTYILTVTDAEGATITANLTINVTPVSEVPQALTITASKTSINVGESVELTVVFNNGTGTIDNGVGNVISAIPVTVAPAITTTYTLTVTDTEGVTTTTGLTIDVVPATVNSPTISSFNASKISVLAGTSIELTAIFSDGTGRIDNSVGSVASGSPIVVTPALTTSYILTVTNGAGTSATASVTVKVTPVPDTPVISDFSATKTSINAGESIELSAVFNGGTGTIDNGVGGVVSGTSVTVTPSQTTTYTLSVDITIEGLFNARVTEQVTIQVTSQTLTAVHYFSADDGINGTELWKTTGSSATTEMVLDINPGGGSSNPRRFFKFNNALYFSANDGTGDEIWKTTDSPSGAVKITSFNNGVGVFPNTSSAIPNVDDIAIYNNKLFFAANDGLTGSELWSIDASDTLTLEADIGDNVAGSRPSWLVVYLNKLYFSAASVLGNTELWAFDANTDTANLVKDVFPGNDRFGFAQPSQPQGLTVFGDALYFSASFSPRALVTDTELFRSRGDSASTSLFFSFSPDSKRSAVKDLDVTPSGMFLWASADFSYELYILDVNSNSPRKVKAIYSSSSFDYLANSYRGVFMTSNNRYYFPQYDGSTVQIWKTDGAAATTTQVTTVAKIPGGIATVGIFVDGAEMLSDSTGRYLYFSTANEGLWVLDTADDSFQLLMDKNAPNSQISDLNMVDDTVYFSASDGINGKELWRSENVPSSAVMVKDINIGASDSQF